MNHADDRMCDLLKRAVGPVGPAELRRDLWPRMQARLEGTRLRVPWWDWVLAALLALCFLLAPGAIPAVLYQL